MMKQRRVNSLHQDGKWDGGNGVDSEHRRRCCSGSHLNTEIIAEQLPTPFSKHKSNSFRRKKIRREVEMTRIQTSDSKLELEEQQTNNG